MPSSGWCKRELTEVKEMIRYFLSSLKKKSSVYMTRKSKVVSHHHHQHYIILLLHLSCKRVCVCPSLEKFVANGKYTWAKNAENSHTQRIWKSANLAYVTIKSVLVMHECNLRMGVLHITQTWLVEKLSSLHNVCVAAWANDFPLCCKLGAKIGMTYCVYFNFDMAKMSYYSCDDGD